MKTKVAVGILVGVVCIVLALWGVSLGELWQAFLAMDSAWLAPIAGLLLVQQALRAERQRVLLAVARPSLSWRNSHAILCISFFCINTLPGRVGELVRPALLWEREKVPLGAGLGIVFLERAIDFIAVLMMVELSLLLAPESSGLLDLGGHPLDLGAAVRRIAWGSVPLLVGMPVVLLGFRRRIGVWLEHGSVDRIPWRPLRWLAGHLLTFAHSFMEALASVRSPRRLAYVLALTAVTWGVSAWMNVMLAYALGFGDRLGYFAAVGVMTITMLGTALPSPPGFAGVYEAFSRGALALFGISGGSLDAAAVAYALVIHWWIALVQAGTAFWYLWRDGISFARLWRIVRTAPSLRP